MLVEVPQVLTAEEVAHCRRVLEETAWVDGRVTAGFQSARTKNNLQVPETAPQAQELQRLVLQALKRNPLFTTAALPFRIFPPLFNRYDEGMHFGAHVDNALRFPPGGGAPLRTDVSVTLFLTDPADYEGGELVIQDTFGTQSVKLEAGAAIVYPSSSLHRVEPVTGGSRWSSFFWVQSMVGDDGQRRLLFEMDQAISSLAGRMPDDPATVQLTACYHNLLRRWAEV